MAAEGLTPEQLAEAHEKHTRVRRKKSTDGTPCAECAGVLPAHAETCPKYVKSPVNLDDPEQQEKILEPKPLQLTIGGEPVEHYPLPANEQCALIFGFMPAVSARASVFGPMIVIRDGKSVGYEQLGPGEQFAELCKRYARVLANSKDLKAEFSRLLARAERKPDAEIEDDDAALALRAKLIDKTLAPREFLNALGRLLIDNEVFLDPKAPAAAKT